MFYLLFYSFYQSYFLIKCLNNRFMNGKWQPFRNLYGLMYVYIQENVVEALQSSQYSSSPHYILKIKKKPKQPSKKIQTNLKG